MLPTSTDRRAIKWGYATHALGELPCGLDRLAGRIQPLLDSPRAHDVIVAEVMEIGQHDGMELYNRRRAALFPGDLIGVAYGNRYATKQFEGTIPPGLDPCHLLAIGGVCGEVIGMRGDMKPPTTLRALGYLLDESGERVNLEAYGLTPIEVPSARRPRIIIVVGSSMDSGKTTVAYSVIHGLTRAGMLVAAGKITGTASAKDPRIMEDAGAAKVMDFTDVGFSSTAMCSAEQLWRIVRTIETHLKQIGPDFIVLEIADGLIQRETDMLLRMMRDRRFGDHAFYACHDSLGVAAGVDRLRDYGLSVVAVSGWVACSPLAATEAQVMTDVPVVRVDQLRDPGVLELITKGVVPAPVVQRLREPGELATRIGGALSSSYT